MAKKIDRIEAICPSSSYDILIGNGILNQVLSEYKPFKKNDILCMIVSKKVYSLHNQTIDILRKELDVRAFLEFEDSEESKSFIEAESFLKRMVESGLTRKSVVLGIGGGVTGDFSSFCASIYMRGIPFINIPTTLLAMVDSSIGGKTAVNLGMGKNIVGTFFQPQFVVADTAFIKTLPENEIHNGLAEIIKHGLLGESETLEILGKNEFSTLDEDDFQRLIFLSALFKSSVVERDEKESGLRAILNLGHTVGHSLESIMQYRGISHGEAVALGIEVEAEISLRLQMISPQEKEKISSLLKRYGMMSKLQGIKKEEVVAHMSYDKKNSSGKMNFVLLEGIGKPVYNIQVPEKCIHDSLDSIL